MTDQHTSPDYSALIDDLAGGGYLPIDDFDEFTPDELPAKTVAYFADRRWDAVRYNGDSLSFVRFGDEGGKLMHTTLSGVITTEASFTVDRVGLRLLALSASCMP